MIFFGIVLLGIISWSRIPQELYPSMEYPQITIVTRYEGAGPEESENLISKLIEETAGTVKNIKRVTSISREGVSVVSCEFRWGTNMDFAAMDVREKIDLVKDALPRDSYDPIVLKYNPTQLEAMIFSASYKSGTSDPMRMADLRRTVKKNVKDELERVEGVAKVELRGGEMKEILVEIDKGRLLANQISITDIIDSLQTANVTYPAGTIKEEKHEYVVKTVGEFKDIGDIESLSFSKTDYRQDGPQNYRRVKNMEADTGQKIVFMRDVADIKEDLKDKQGFSRYNGKENISISIYQQSGSNLINLSEAVTAKLADVRAKLPEDVEIIKTYDQSEFIKSSLTNLYTSAFQGIMLSFILLYFFTRSFMASTIINTAIPVSLCVTLSLMYFGDITINTMSLGGLTVGIGMVVDNSNMVLENILLQYHKAKNVIKKEAIAEATSSLLPPIVSSTFTTVAIFIPFIFVAGMIGQMFKQMALTISFAMVASISAAMLLVPRLALNADLTKQSISAGMGTINKFFRPLFIHILNWRIGKITLIVLVYLASGLVVLAFTPKEFMPKVDERRFVLNVNLRPDTPIEITDTTVKKIEDLLLRYDGINDISTSVGSTGESTGSAAIETLTAYQARIVARLNPQGAPTQDIVADIAAEIRKWNMPNLETEFITQQGLFGSGAGGSSGLTVEIKGQNLTRLKEAAHAIRAQMENMNMFYGIKIDPSEEVPELRLIIDRERASLFGLSTQDISAILLASIKGFVATKLKEKDDEKDIRVRMRAEDRDRLGKILEITALSAWGMTIQIKQIVDASLVPTLPAIRRIEGERTYLITANVRGSFAKATSELQTILDERYQTNDVSTKITGEMLAMKEALSQTGFAMGLGAIIIFMILASQFESVVQPVIVMTAVPLGLIGALISLFVTFQTINAISMLGMIMLVGNVVNISILLVDRFNLYIAERLKTNGNKPLSIVELKQLVVDVTISHMRAITMTTATTIISLVPLALGIGMDASTNQPMAIAVVGGLTFALALAVFFVPYVYLVYEGMRNNKPEELLAEEIPQ
jgi:HAE1 family hydrophobic/amphiphilic exporter-1